MNKSKKENEQKGGKNWGYIKRGDKTLGEEQREGRLNWVRGMCTLMFTPYFRSLRMYILDLVIHVLRVIKEKRTKKKKNN